MDQSLAQNIQEDIDTKTFIVYWKMRNWKTLNAIIMALEFYPRIYSNFQIYQNGQSIVKYIESYEYIKNIRFSKTPGVLIIDEAGLNVNSKDSFSKDSRIMHEVLFLIGKKNLSLIWIAQRFESIDINARSLVDIIIKMRKIQRPWKHPVFIATKQRLKKGWSLEFITSYNLDSLSIMKYYNITYDQLEASKITKSKDTIKTSKPLTTNKKLWII